jgi:hypothetical protein
MLVFNENDDLHIPRITEKKAIPKIILTLKELTK